MSATVELLALDQHEWRMLGGDRRVRGPPGSERLGFAHLGQIVDPEDGPVWRWERAPGSSPA